MRGLVRVVPMKRDILKVPKLGSKPKLRWTSENAAKSTNSCGYKICANLIENMVNCWNILLNNRTISSQAIT